jgi:hypothetical protein
MRPPKRFDQMRYLVGPAPVRTMIPPVWQSTVSDTRKSRPVCVGPPITAGVNNRLEFSDKDVGWGLAGVCDSSSARPIFAKEYFSTKSGKEELKIKLKNLIA